MPKPPKVVPPAPPQVPHDLWGELYEAAKEFQTLAPWQWMDDTDILGINNEHGVRLLSVLGAMSEVFGVVSYRGSTGTNFLLRLLAGEFDPENDEMVFHQDACLVDFVPRTQLQVEDRSLMRQLGFQPIARQPKLYPEFQSHKPGFVPWFVNEAEARLLLDGLRKIIPFAILLRDEPELFDARQEYEFPFFPTTLAGPLQAKDLEWHILVPMPPPLEPPVDPAGFEANWLRTLPATPRSNWELIAFFSHIKIGESPRPYFPKMALAVEVPTGMVLAFHLGKSTQNFSQTAAEGLIDAIKAKGCRPITLRLDSDELRAALQPLAENLGIKLKLVAELPLANEARESLDNFSPEV